MDAEAVRRQPRRYDNLLSEIGRLRARSILEIGTYKGAHAEQMIRAAAEYRPASEVAYYGFDLFDPPPAYECTPRTVPPPMAEVMARLQATGAKIHLVQGDSRETLPKAMRWLKGIDLVFVDGGHSAETVASDWNCVRQLMHNHTVVIFDDYWNYPEGGSNRTVDGIAADGRFSVELLEPVDVFARSYGELRTQFARVQRR